MPPGETDLVGFTTLVGSKYHGLHFFVNVISEGPLCRRRLCGCGCHIGLEFKLSPASGAKFECEIAVVEFPTAAYAFPQPLRDFQSHGEPYNSHCKTNRCHCEISFVNVSAPTAIVRFLFPMSPSQRPLQRFFFQCRRVNGHCTLKSDGCVTFGPIRHFPASRRAEFSPQTDPSASSSRIAAGSILVRFKPNPSAIFQKGGQVKRPKV